MTTLTIVLMRRRWARLEESVVAHRMALKVAELLRMETRADVLLVFRRRQVTDSVICTSASKALP